MARGEGRFEEIGSREWFQIQTEDEKILTETCELIGEKWSPGKFGGAPAMLVAEATTCDQENSENTDNVEVEYQKQDESKLSPSKLPGFDKETRDPSPYSEFIEEARTALEIIMAPLEVTIDLLGFISRLFK